MRKVVDASQVCHLWANKSQDEARTPSGNIYFTGPTLYSYGSHFVIAHHLETGGILWNDASYSVTTSKQQSFARQSLASWQREKVIAVPSLNADDVRELERVKRDGEGRKLPGMVRAIADGIVSIVEDMARMREGKGPETHAFRKIKSREAAGLAMCAYVAKGKRAPKWPLAPLPDTMPTGDARKAWIQSVAKGELLATHDGSLSLALERLAEVSGVIEAASGMEKFGDGWRIQNITGSLDAAGRSLTEAGLAYEAATGKKSAKVRNAWKKRAELAAIAGPIVSQWNAVRARRAIREYTREFWQAFRSMKNGTRRAGRDIGFYRSKLVEAVSMLPPHEAATHAAFLERVGRVDDWHCAETGLDSARRKFETAMSYFPAYPGDAAREFRSANMHAEEAARRHPAFRALHAEELSSILGTGQKLLTEAKAAIEREHAQKIEAWKAGENVHLSYSVGTLARIKGNIVQTSLGASVPLSHACRLARIARRVIAHGGKVWEHGQGPRVGGFMVRSIGADGAAVIGCHEFDSIESLRMLALLDACPECQGVAADDTHED